MKTIHCLTLFLILVVASCDSFKDDDTSSNLSTKSFDTTGLVRTSDPISEIAYWKLVNESRVSSVDDQGFIKILTRKLAVLSPIEIAGFRLRTDLFLKESYGSEMWCAGSILNGGCSDDGFEYFRLWVISQGENIFNAAKNNPDSLNEIVSDEKMYYEFEAFWYVANDAFKNRTGRDLYDYIDFEIFHAVYGNYVDFDFNWSYDNPASMSAICPNLYARFIE